MQPRKLHLERTQSYDPDLLMPLPETHHGEFGTCVLSAEAKASGGQNEIVVVGNYVVTGLVSSLGDRQFAKLRPLLIGQHALTRFNWRGYVQEQLEHGQLVEAGFVEGLTKVKELAQSSRAAGGLLQVSYPIDVGSRPLLSDDSTALPNREKVQLGRFLMANAHLTKHIETDPGIWALRQEAVSTIGFGELELYFCELYALARAFGVKEILPKIWATMREEVSELTQTTDEKESNTRLASLVVKLKRRGLL